MSDSVIISGIIGISAIIVTLVLVFTHTWNAMLEQEQRKDAGKESTNSNNTYNHNE